MTAICAYGRVERALRASVDERSAAVAIHPRALCDGPWIMARPARSVQERQAVIAAAAQVLGSIQVKARVVAAQVLAELMLEVERGWLTALK